jgi:hypothetical protein
MKQSLLLISFLFFSLLAFGQFQVTPVPASIAFQPEEFDVHADARLSYNGSTPVTLRWNIVNLNGPKEWVVYTCLGNACYEPGQLQGFQDLAPGEEMIIQAHIFPQGGCGVGSYEITFTDTASNQVVATGVFNFQCQASSISSGFGNAKPGSIYPNPAVTWFSVSEIAGAARVEMYNIIGKQVAQFSFQPTARYDISSLPGGMYLVRVMDQQGRVLVTRRMSKNTP